MKKYMLLLAMLVPSVGFAETVHLNCDSGTHKYDLVVNFMEDGANITVDGTSYNFISEYDARAAFYSEEPWMRLEVGNRRYQAKYTFAALGNDQIPLYMPCDEIAE